MRNNEYLNCCLIVVDDFETIISDREKRVQNVKNLIDNVWKQIGVLIHYENIKQFRILVSNQNEYSVVRKLLSYREALSDEMQVFCHDLNFSKRIADKNTGLKYLTFLRCSNSDIELINHAGGFTTSSAVWFRIRQAVQYSSHVYAVHSGVEHSNANYAIQVCEDELNNGKQLYYSPLEQANIVQVKKR